MIEVEAPDGTVVEFPDGTDNNTIRGVMSKRWGAPRQQAAPAVAPTRTPPGGFSLSGIAQTTAPTFVERERVQPAGAPMQLTTPTVSAPSALGMATAQREQEQQQRSATEMQQAQQFNRNLPQDIGRAIPTGPSMLERGATALGTISPTGERAFRDIQAGTGQVASGTANVMDWLNISPQTQQQIRRQSDPMVAIAPRNPTLVDNVVQSLPLTLALMPVGVGTGALAAAGVARAGAGVGLQSLTGALAGGVSGRVVESAFEAGDAYKSMIDNGVSREDAARAANTVYAENLALVGLDAGELALAFGKAIVPALRNMPTSRLRTALKFVASAGMEGGEEWLQSAIQESATGIEQDKAEAALIGAITGGLFQSAGALTNHIQQRAVAAMPADAQQEYSAAAATGQADNAFAQLVAMYPNAAQSAMQEVQNQIAETQRAAETGSITEKQQVSGEVSPAEQTAAEERVSPITAPVAPAPYSNLTDEQLAAEVEKAGDRQRAFMEQEQARRALDIAPETMAQMDNETIRAERDAAAQANATAEVEAFDRLLSARERIATLQRITEQPTAQETSNIVDQETAYSQTIAAHEYKNGVIRDLAYSVKSGDEKSIKTVANDMAKVLPDPKNAVLIPIPSSYGDTTNNLMIAEEISRITGAKIADILTNPIKQSQRQARINGIKTLSPEQMGMKLRGNIPNGNIYFVDNVTTTGSTIRAARDIVGRGIGLVYAKATPYIPTEMYIGMPITDLVQAVIDSQAGVGTYDAMMALGNRVYADGAQTWQQWHDRVRSLAGKAWSKIQPILRRVWRDVQAAARVTGRIARNAALLPITGGVSAWTPRTQQGKAVAGTARSKFTETVQESQRTAAPVASELERRTPEQQYDKRWNAQDFEQAKYNIAMNREEVKDRLSKINKGSLRPNSVDIIAAQLLIDEAQRKGDFGQAVQMVEDISQTLTKLGQAVQAASIWNRLSPEGVLRYAKRNTEPGVVTDAIAEQLYNRAKDIDAMPDGRPKDIARAVLLRDIAAMTPPSKANQLATLLAMAQLLNPKTIIRNLGGNTIFMGAENVSKTLGAAVDAVAGLFSGKRSMRATGMRGLKTQFNGFAKGWKDGLEEARAGVDLSPTRTQFDIQAPGAFRGKIGTAGERLLNYALRVPDRAAFTAAYAESLLDQAQNIALNEKLTGDAYEKRVSELVDNPTEPMNAQAVEDGLYRTFADNNITTSFFSGVKSTANVIGVGPRGQRFGLGNIILNYPKVPANLLNRMIAYSPIGAARSLYELSKLMPLTRITIEAGQRAGVVPSDVDSRFNQRNFAMATARAAVGSIGLTAFGAMLKAIGLLDDKEEDKQPAVAELRRRSGTGRYRINVSGLQRYIMGGFNREDASLRKNDLLVSYDWAQPLSASMAMGANAADMQGIEAALSAMDTIAEQPLVSGLMRSLSMFGSTDGDRISNFVKGTIEAAPAAFVPTLLSQINQWADNTDREKWDPVFSQRIINNVLAKLPVMSAWLPPRSYMGETAERYAQGGNSFFNVFFNPSFAARYMPKPEAELMMNLYRSTGEKRGVIDRIDKKLRIPGQKESYELSAEQWLRMNRNMQQAVVRRMNTDLRGLTNINDVAREMSAIITDERRNVREAMIQEVTGKTPDELRDAAEE